VDGWELALTPAGACAGPAEAARLTAWIPARAPGTTAQALAAAGRWRQDAPEALHDLDVWWRSELTPGAAGSLCFEGLATLAQAWLDETPLFTSTSMYLPHSVPLAEGAGGVLWICFRALGRELATKGPRARWRPLLISEPNLRRVRTSVLGHMPGWRRRTDIVGPWRPVWRITEPAGPRIVRAALRPWVGPGGPELAVTLELADGEGAPAPVVVCAAIEVTLASEGQGRFAGALHMPEAALWWPHTHGQPAVHTVRVRLGADETDLGRTGFRTVGVDAGEDGQGFALRVNGEPVFCRGACWANPDSLGLSGAREAYLPALRAMREAGMNMVRVSGAGVYESPAFHALCDELGLMVWQDFMFANFDYPAQEPAFVDAVRAEVRAVLEPIQAAPSLAVLCGGSEVFQQAAMMGLPGDASWPLFDEILPEAARAVRPDVPYVANSPSGGALPFVADRGVTHYYGVGAYERPLEDVRRAGVRFAAECLAFANVPEAQSLKGVLDGPAVHDPRWKARVPRDRGASWDFEDTRDRSR
jgi:beta-mannosidase